MDKKDKIGLTELYEYLGGIYKKEYSKYDMELGIRYCDGTVKGLKEMIGNQLEEIEDEDYQKNGEEKRDYIRYKRLKVASILNNYGDTEKVGSLILDGELVKGHDTEESRAMSIKKIKRDIIRELGEVCMTIYIESKKSPSLKITNGLLQKEIEKAYDKSGQDLTKTKDSVKKAIQKIVMNQRYEDYKSVKGICSLVGVTHKEWERYISKEEEERYKVIRGLKGGDYRLKKDTSLSRDKVYKEEVISEGYRDRVRGVKDEEARMKKLSIRYRKMYRKEVDKTARYIVSYRMYEGYKTKGKELKGVIKDKRLSGILYEEGGVIKSKIAKEDVWRVQRGYNGDMLSRDINELGIGYKGIKWKLSKIKKVEGLKVGVEGLVNVPSQILVNMLDRLNWDIRLVERELKGYGYGSKKGISEPRGMLRLLRDWEPTLKGYSEGYVMKLYQNEQKRRRGKVGLKGSKYDEEQLSIYERVIVKGIQAHNKVYM